MHIHKLFLFAIDTIKGEYPEEQWPYYKVPELERAAADLHTLLAALKSMTDAYQQHFDVMPVAWQTFENIAREAIRRAEGI